MKVWIVEGKWDGGGLLLGPYWDLPKLVVARSTPEARMLYREHFYNARRPTPVEVRASVVSMDRARLLDAHDEQSRLVSDECARESAEVAAP